MKYSLDKYRFIVNKNTVIAISTYAGKTVKGIAKLNPKDEFDVRKGKELAAARCNAKIATKRYKRAKGKINEAQAILEEARNYYEKMSTYFKDAEREEAIAKIELNTLESVL